MSVRKKCTMRNGLTSVLLPNVRIKGFNNSNFGSRKYWVISHKIGHLNKEFGRPRVRSPLWGCWWGGWVKKKKKEGRRWARGGGSSPAFSHQQSSETGESSPGDCPYIHWVWKAVCACVSFLFSSYLLGRGLGGYFTEYWYWFIIQNPC